MSPVNENKKVDFDIKIKEAEIYESQGLLAESLQILEELLADYPEIDTEVKNTITEKIQFLTGEIDEFEKKKLLHATEDPSVLDETLSTEEEIEEIINSASSFEELGLFKEAIEEYKKLFAHDYPIAETTSKLTGCLFELHSPSKVIDQIEKIVTENNFSDNEKAEINFKLGTIMEEKEHNDLALEIYESVQEIDQQFENVKQKIKSIHDSRAYDSRYGFLLESKIITTTQLQNALSLSKKSKRSVEHVLMEQNRVKKEDIGKSLSLFYKCPFIVHDPQAPVPYELLTKLKKTFLIQNSWVPLGWEMASGIVDVLIDDPGDLTKTDNIFALMKAKKINYSVGIKEDISRTIHMFFDLKGKTGSQTVNDTDSGFDMMDLDIDFEEEEDPAYDVPDEIDEASSQIVRLVDQILITAYRSNVSDIHIEPSPPMMKAGIRFRIDGVCQDFLQVPLKNARAILSRLKIMGGMDIAERRLPQDGKIKFKRKGIKPFELRMATLPTAGGFEDAVLRILAEFGSIKIGEMGLTDRNLDIVKRVITQPYGLFLAVGPTGSGKTTTLHSALGYINKPGIKIWTAEDPVEITQPGLRQVQCQAKIGLDFARVMRSFLRADPDVIMIGEMRDEETAAIGIEASLTGHLVFSTLHTNSAPETVTRLLDMGLNPLNFSDAFLAVLAQRLARKICSKCRKKYQPSNDEIESIISIYGKEDFESHAVKLTPDTSFYKSIGCEECHGTGYKGRFAIHELMEGTGKIKIMIKGEADTEELFVQAKKDGMTTLIQDGISKALEGTTDIPEIRRVCVT
jgi:type II secretory ATPase GspE/PulE/Tfp pilus assembly ATPase PilB-like protein